MRWDDERYVRLYTRDTANWLKWPWQARALLPLLLRKVDRAGLLKLSRSEIISDLSAVVGLPHEVVSVGLSALRKHADDERATVEVSDAGLLLVPNHMEAQEAGTSNRLRQEDSRRRARDAAHKPAESLDTVSHPVTGSNGVSQPVTVCHSVPSLPFRSEPPVPRSEAPTDAAPTTARKPKVKTAKPSPPSDGQHKLVVDGWEALYRARTGSGYPWASAAEHGRVETLLKLTNRDAAEVLRRADVLCNNPPAWLAKGGGAPTLSTLVANFAALVDAKPPERTYNGRG